jgi:hypothetical protein
MRQAEDRGRQQLLTGVSGKGAEEASGRARGQSIEVNLTSENPRPILAGTVDALTFSVTWIETNKPFETRFDR